MRGDDRRGESFIGHGGGPSVSAYPHLGHLGPARRILHRSRPGRRSPAYPHLGRLGPAPLSGVLRLSGSYADYIRDYATAPQFVLPPDEWSAAFRAGLRLGGQEPGIDTAPAGEVSAWWETHKREHTALYGYNGDRVAQGQTNLYWTRFLFDYTTDAGSRMGLGMSAGGGTDGHRSPVRLPVGRDAGAERRVPSDFARVLPAQEIAARRISHAWIRMPGSARRAPSTTRKKYTVNVLIHRQRLRGRSIRHAGRSIRHAGAGNRRGRNEALRRGGGHRVHAARRGAAGAASQLDYGYSPTAMRGGRRGGQGVALSVEVNFETQTTTPRSPIKAQQGLRWLLGPIGR